MLFKCKKNNKKRFYIFAANPGFTMIELMIIVVIMVTLTSIVTVSFSQMRSTQSLQAAANDLISKIREIQNFTYTGRQISGGQPPRAYIITFTANATTFLVQYNIGTTTTTLETVSLPQNTKIQQLLVSSAPRTPVAVRMEAPFSELSVNGSPSQSLQIDITNIDATQVKSIVIDPISKRIGAQ